MNIFKSFSRKTLTITLTLFLLFCSVSTYSWYYNFTKEAEKTAKENIGVLISTLNSTFESNLREIDYTTALISNKVRTSQNRSLIQYLTLSNTQTMEMVTALQEAQSYLLSRCNFKSYLNGLAVYGLDGRTCTYGVTTPYREVYIKDWFQQIKDGEHDVLYLAPHSYTETEHAPLSGRVFSIVRPVMNNEEIIGVIKADIKISLLDTIFDIQPLSGYMLYIVESNSGELIYAPEDSSNVDVTELHRQMQSEKQGSMTTEIAGDDYLVVFSASEVTPWTLIGIVEQNNVISGFVEVRQEMLILTMVCIVLFVAFMGVVVRLITRDLRKLTSAVSSINDENISIDVNIRSQDEVGTLYQQICAMLNRIRNLVADIRRTEGEKREAEIKMLSLQINPHFLYNTLHTIKVLSLMQGTENITTVTDALSNILHLNLDTRKFISMPEETDYLRDYLSMVHMVLMLIMLLMNLPKHRAVITGTIAHGQLV